MSIQSMIFLMCAVQLVQALHVESENEIADSDGVFPTVLAGCTSGNFKATGTAPCRSVENLHCDSGGTCVGMQEGWQLEMACNRKNECITHKLGSALVEKHLGQSGNGNVAWSNGCLWSCVSTGAPKVANVGYSSFPTLGQTVKTATEGYFGRLVHGQNDEDFEYLTPKSQVATRKIVFMTDVDGLHDLLSSNMDIRATLASIGYGNADAKKLLCAGERFKLVVSKETEFTPPPVRATWFGITRVGKDAYTGTSWGTYFGKLHNFFTSLSAVQMGEMFALEFLHTMNKVFKTSHDIDEGGCDSVDLTSPPTINHTMKQTGFVSVRCWLYSNADCNSLYTGTGWTKTPTGARGLKEWVAVNQKIPNAAEQIEYDTSAYMGANAGCSGSNAGAETK